MPSKNCYSALHVLTKIIRPSYVRNKTVWTASSCFATALLMTGEAVVSLRLSLALVAARLRCNVAYSGQCLSFDDSLW